MKNTLTAAMVREWLDYRDGKLYWRKRTNRRIVVGSEAKCGGRRDGRAMISILRKHSSRSRAVWMWHHGDIPCGMEVDHVNRDGTDDRIENLRLATRAQNAWNTCGHRDSASGMKGVTHEPRTGKWYARIGKRHIGTFATAAEASAAYWARCRAERGEFVPALGA